MELDGGPPGIVRLEADEEVVRPLHPLGHGEGDVHEAFLAGRQGCGTHNRAGGSAALQCPGLEGVPRREGVRDLEGGVARVLEREAVPHVLPDGHLPVVHLGAPDLDARGARAAGGREQEEETQGDAVQPGAPSVSHDNPPPKKDVSQPGGGHQKESAWPRRERGSRGSPIAVRLSGGFTPGSWREHRLEDPGHGAGGAAETPPGGGQSLQVRGDENGQEKPGADPAADAADEPPAHEGAHPGPPRGEKHPEEGLGRLEERAVEKGRDGGRELKGGLQPRLVLQPDRRAPAPGASHQVHRRFLACGAGCQHRRRAGRRQARGQRMGGVGRRMARGAAYRANLTSRASVLPSSMVTSSSSLRFESEESVSCTR